MADSPIREHWEEQLFLAIIVTISLPAIGVYSRKQVGTQDEKESNDDSSRISLWINQIEKNGSAPCEKTEDQCPVES